MLWGALANNAPDLDVFPGVFQSVPDSLLTHRGFTHSILFATLAPPLLAWLFQKFFRKKDYGFATWYIIFVSAFFSHIFVDSLTNYGTGWFEPFSHYRVSFNTIFVLDPFYSISLLVAFICLLILKSKSHFRKYFLFGGLIISSTYLVFTFFNKITINRQFLHALEKNGIVAEGMLTTPTPLNNILWYDLAKYRNGFYLGYRSLFDQSPDMQLAYVPRNDSLLGDFKSNAGVQKLIRFSQGFYCITKSDSSGVDFHDMRFGQIDGWNHPDGNFVFTYHISEGKSNKVEINQGRFASVSGDAFHSLIERIKGIP